MSFNEITMSFNDLIMSLLFYSPLIRIIRLKPNYSVETELFGRTELFGLNRIIRFKPNSKSINKPPNRIIRELFVEPNYSEPNYSESELFGFYYSDSIIRIVTTEF